MPKAPSPCIWGVYLVADRTHANVFLFSTIIELWTATDLGKSRFGRKKIEEISLLAREERAPLASKKKSPLLHPRQEETETFLQSKETDKNSISKR